MFRERLSRMTVTSFQPLATYRRLPGFLSLVDLSMPTSERVFFSLSMSMPSVAARRRWRLASLTYCTVHPFWPKSPSQPGFSPRDRHPTNRTLAASFPAALLEPRPDSNAFRSKGACVLARTRVRPALAYLHLRLISPLCILNKQNDACAMRCEAKRSAARLRPTAKV
ncbi:hypothetical protein CSUB01_07057 [Colletotrichum sublineola]|uniref:Uncharacterized protein n=1 Tax=Colletotrichum sublineola TaxID=1173701 RepID=A0A066XJE0_COLSU|nr:hypothetical protein CSUB01_07057 [Colletotrichum sublineola]